MHARGDRMSTDLAELVRGRQAHAEEHNVRRALGGSVAAAGLTLWLFHDTDGALLWPWFVATLVWSSVRLTKAWRATRSPPGRLSKAAVWPLTVWSAFGAVVVSSGPVWIALHATGFEFAYMLSLALGVFWCGAFVYAPLFETAVSFASAQMLVWIIGAVEAGLDESRLGLMALYAVGTAVGLHVIREHSRLSRRSLILQFDLEQKTVDLKGQTDVIGLLLKEHEDQSSDWLWTTDASLRIAQPSQRFVEVAAALGIGLDGAPVLDLFGAPDLDGNAEALLQLRRHLDERRSFRDLVVPFRMAGEARWWSVSGRPVTVDGTFEGYRGVIGDVTAAKLAEGRVVYLAHHDALTELPNRAYFCQRLSEALRFPDAGRIAVISLDLDGFKPVNDRYGHPVGDKLLGEIATRLRAQAARADVVARFGGDEFAIMTNRTDPVEVETFCLRLLEALSAPVEIDGVTVAVGTSLGVAFAPLDGNTTDELVKNADSALYRAKHEGRGTFRFFAPDMDRSLQVRQQLIQDMRTALARNQFSLHYQPFVSSSTGCITGCEALLRWHHPVHGLVPPVDFIPLAEESGLIVPIGNWVLEEGCREAASWGGDRRVSINISPVQFRDRELPERILAALRKAGLSPSRLEVEITETVLVDDAGAALDILRRIRALGVRLALDDFGTGYSSLSYLRRFPFDKIKIDRSFVRELTERRDSQVIVQAIHDIALGLDMTITAEGVETAAQAAQLRETGCHELQGYLFSKPRPSHGLDEVLEQCFAA